MNDDENFIIEKVTTLLEQRKTGAIPRNMDYSSQYLPSFYWDTIEKINNGLRVCIILRGLPGSGKSFLGKKIIQDTINDNESEHIISADDYFMRNGKYQYDPSKIPEAHDSSQKLFFNRASKGYSPLVVDNTNMKIWEMYPYIQAAIQYNYHVEIMEPQTPWKWSASKLALKNKHSVNADKIKKMKDNYEKVVSVKEFVKNTLNLDIVKEPFMRNYPPFQSKPALTNYSFDLNKNRKSTITEERGEPLSWQKFNTDLKKQTTSNYFSWDQPKKSQEEVDHNNWIPPAQIFEDKWDQPTEKEITIKEKEDKPQPQRMQRKNKKPSTPPSDSPELKPHRRNCPNENQSFAQLRELYPNINDHLLWDFFEKCKGDAEWCADMLCDEILTESMDIGEDLTCICSSSDSSIQRKFNDNNNNNNNNGNNGNNKKQTPIKAKKAKSNTEDILAAKMEIEKNVRIGQEFYPEHVNRVKVWKGISTRMPQSIQESSEHQVMSSKAVEEDTLVALTIEEGLITDLCELFGGGKEFMKELIDQNKNFNTKMFIKSSTAEQLYKEILETFYSHQEEAKLKEIENDRSYAMMLHEQEKAFRYPQLNQNGTDCFKDIMDTQAALKEYEDEVGWQKIEKTETMAEKLSKEKLYRAFSGVEKDTINEIFEAQDKDFKKTIEIIQDSLGYTDEMRKQVNDEIESTVKFNKQPSVSVEDDKEEEEFTHEEYACIKKVEELQEQFDRHSEEQMRCIQKSREHIARKEYHTASYYTSMVNLHKQLCDEKRQQLMNILAFSFLNNASSTRLDLHYFNQEGAKTRLHTFLDAHIAKLREINKQFIELEIVTGRGAHSLRGPVLKNMTIKLFQERGLRYSESNPGLLKVKVFPNSMLYEEKQRLMKTEN